MAEPFHLWVIEAPDAVQKLFPAVEAELQVKFVKDLTPYRTRKVRILNGAHTAMVPVAYLQGLRTVREAIDDTVAGEFVKNVIEEEIIPTLDLSAEELKQFAHDVMERFQNPYIRHELISIALNSISKYQVRVLPSVLEYIKRKRQLPKYLLHSLAALILFYKGEWQGQTIPLNDTPAVLEFFKHAWSKNDTAGIIKTVLANKDLWGMDLTTVDGLAEMVEKELQRIEKVQVGNGGHTFG
jgi:tagaturonate reductase